MGWSDTFLTFARDERVLLVSFGLATFGVVSTMVTYLTLIRDENLVPPPEPKTQYITQETEDALQLDTLQKLLNHSNYSIREIATRILCDRALNDPKTIDYLLYGITRPNYNERMDCLRVLALITQTIGTDGLPKLNNPKAYAALVRSLELSLEDVDRPKLDDCHWDEYYLRDMAERFCLMFVLELCVKYGANKIVQAGFVERWLVKQDWGDTPEERRRNFRNYMEFKDNRIVEIVNHIKHCLRGLRALEKADLINKEHSKRRIEELPDLIMEVEEEMAGEPLLEPQIPRAREHSAEEQRLRRQRREAIVLNDGTRPLVREDIIERNHGSPT